MQLSRQGGQALIGLDVLEQRNQVSHPLRGSQAELGCMAADGDLYPLATSHNVSRDLSRPVCNHASQSPVDQTPGRLWPRERGMQMISYEQAVAEKFRLPRAPTRLARQDAVAPIAFSRLHSEGALRQPTMSAPPEEAVTFQVALSPMAAGEIWIDGRHSKLPAAAPGDTFVFDLSTNPIARLTPPYDFVRFYLPVATLGQLAYQRGLRPVRGVRTTSLGVQDPVMLGLALSVLPTLEDPDECSTLFLDSVALAFSAHVMHSYRDAVEDTDTVKTRLAPWQLRRATAFIEANLDGDPSIAVLAAECRLSASHFARAFRHSTGMPPHQWLMKRRIERAKELLLDGKSELVQVALACGFVDQSHFTRVFARFEGRSPGKWRWLCVN
jgi:AraC family transcriptional regulator